MNSSKCLNQTVMFTLDKQHSWHQLPKSLARHVPFVKWFQAVVVYKLLLFLARPLYLIYYICNLLGNFPGTLPWSLHLQACTFPALRIIQPHLPLPIGICTRPFGHIIVSIVGFQCSNCHR